MKQAIVDDEEKGKFMKKEDHKLKDRKRKSDVIKK